MAQRAFENTLNQVTKGDGSLMRSLSGGQKGSKSNRVTPKKRNDVQGDRFIPVRSDSSNTEQINLLLHKNGSENDLTEEQRAYDQKLEECFNPNNDSHNEKILTFTQKLKSGRDNAASVIPEPDKESKHVSSKRKIASEPTKILDAPNIVNDFYLNTIDWSRSNILAVGLADAVYLWNANNGVISELMTCGEEDEIVTCVNWLPVSDSLLATGSSYGRVQLWDVTTSKLIRTMITKCRVEPARSRIPSLSWNQHLLTSGSRYGWIRHNDVRVADFEVAGFKGHSMEVCGLAWSPDSLHLASGGNDNIVNIYQSQTQQPLYTLSSHVSAVKAVSWCPWKPNLLATGGGLNDRNLRFWSMTTGAAIKSVDTGSTVSGIVWNEDYREIVTSHGEPNHQLSIWKYPNIAKVADLNGHTSRTLSLSKSPDSQMVLSSSADETLRIWHCFPPLPNKKKDVCKDSAIASVVNTRIR